MNTNYTLQYLPMRVLIEGRGEGDDRGEEKGTTEDEMVGWHHRLNGHEFEQTLGDSDVQGGLACCSPRSHRVRHD